MLCILGLIRRPVYFNSIHPIDFKVGVLNTTRYEQNIALRENAEIVGKRVECLVIAGGGGIKCPRHVPSHVSQSLPA